MKVVLCFSGGVDSTVLLWHLWHSGYHVRCLSVDYGQRHAKELKAAEEIARLAGVESLVADLRPCRHLFAGSSQTTEDIPVPEGHYTHESMKQTVVPNRNMVLLSLACALAVSTKSEGVAYAAHSGDHTIYPDCRPEFGEAMDHAMSLCDWHTVRLMRPFSGMDKRGIVTLGSRLGAPLGKTWSCYKGGEFHCGVCGTCVERREAFRLAQVPDPTLYLTSHYKE